jgi:hypothetical protein
MADHTPLQVKKNATGKSRWTAEEDVEVLARELGRMMPDQSIAAVLNRAGKLTGRQNGWTQGKVCGLRRRLGANLIHTAHLAMSLESAGQDFQVAACAGAGFALHRAPQQFPAPPL